MTVKHQRTASQLLYSYSEQRKKRSAKFELFQTQLPCFLELGGTVALRLLHKYRHANREKTHGNQENIFISMTAHTQHLGGKKYCKVKKTPGNREKSRQPNQTETTHQNTETSCRYRTCMQMWKSTEYTDTMQAVQTMRGGVHFSEASVSLISWFGYHVELSAVCSR